MRNRRTYLGQKMLGNLSQPIIIVPNSFKFISKIPTKELSKTRYRNPPLLDAFSQLKRLNSPINRRYFRFKDHFNGNSPCKDLNYNNDKRITSSMTKLSMISSQHSFFSDFKYINKKLRKNKSQTEIISNKNNNSNNSSKISKAIDNNTNYQENILLSKINSEENKIDNIEDNNQIINEIKDCNKIEYKINNDNNNNNKKTETNNKRQNSKEKKKEIEIYFKKIREKKPNDLKGLKNFLEMKYKEKRKDDKLPKLKNFNKKNFIPQDDLFKKTLRKKIESLTTIRPEVKKFICKRKKNLILKRDYDLFQIFLNDKKLGFKG